MSFILKTHAYKIERIISRKNISYFKYFSYFLLTLYYYNCVARARVCSSMCGNGEELFVM